MKNLISRIVLEAFCILLIILFTYAALSKLLDFEEFQVQLNKSPILSPFANFLSYVIPTMEIAISILFLWDASKLVAFYLSYGLMVSFTAYIVAILKFSDYIPCSCGGVLANMTWTQHIFFNLFFIAISIIGVIIYPDKNLSADKGRNRKPLKE